MGLVRAKLLSCVVAALLPVSFGRGGPGSSEEGEETALTVYAASSLTDAFGELKADFEEEHPGTEAKLNFAGSSTLLTQLEQGAPADVFASADEAKMDAAVSDGLVEAPRPSPGTASPLLLRRATRQASKATETSPKLALLSCSPRMRCRSRSTLRRASRRLTPGTHATSQRGCCPTWHRGRPT